MRIPAGTYTALLCELLAEGTPVITAVRGGSMWPFIPDGAVVRIVPVTAAGVRVGEVIVRRRRDDSPVCHRLSRRRGDQVQTWGDAAADPDGWGPVTEVIGRVVSIEGAGGPYPLVVRSPLRMGWRYVKRRLRRWLRAGQRPAPPPCAPDSVSEPSHGVSGGA